MFSQKINWGSLEKIPEICVNRFGTMSEAHDIIWDKSQAFFLTHCDPVTMSDLLNGALLSWAAHPFNPSPDRIYMHALSFKMLQYYATTQFVVDGVNKLCLLSQLLVQRRIVFVKPHNTFRLKFGSDLSPLKAEVIDVTPLSAGSCPGSVMYLFEKKDVEENCILRILHTGNCRLSLKDLKKMTPLFEIGGNVKRIDTVYLDTAHFNPDSADLPSRRLAIEKTMDLIENHHTLLDTEFQFAISGPYDLFDAVFVKELFCKFHKKIHIGDSLCYVFKDIGLGIPEAFSINDASAFFHFNCGLSEPCYVTNFRTTCKLDLHCHVGLNEYKIHYLQSTDTSKWNVSKEAAYIRKRQDIACIYATNLSRYEAARMLTFLHVPMDKVKPLYIPNGMSLLQLQDLMNFTSLENIPEEPSHLLSDFPCFYFDFTCGPVPHQEYCSNSKCNCKHPEIHPFDHAVKHGDLTKFGPKFSQVR